ncbi:rhodanese-like domain-containing protein [Penaeicola halotolerans]|uniref:rhodanese-like domain-containing protein n=1 Tax=Penaeicola halotolerans TaxID=2793196 RepID=UPI001CF90EA3|nr:rhodanese-like domain-containing protein [Penaeicola halotolerans]
MEIKQFYDEGLAHASYAIYSEGKVALVDPGRDPQPYIDFATERKSDIVAVFETHPHADFVSSHFELHQKRNATIYVSKLVGADYPHQGFDEGDMVEMGAVKFKSLHTPGHSPDSISILLIDENGREHALFSGDTLFIGDVGRPDLREKAGNLKAQRADLAKMMYHTVQNKLKPLADHIIVYPAHGAGSLCGKNLSDERQSTIGEQRMVNWAFGNLDEQTFVNALLEGQPYIPKYFGYDVALNKQGAPHFDTSLKAVKIEKGTSIPAGAVVIDVRKQTAFVAGHIPGAINIMDGGKFETWLGSIVGPEEKYYLISDNEAELERVILKTTKIGYELNIAGAVVNPTGMTAKGLATDVADFAKNQERYTIVDIRSVDERKSHPIFANSLNIPLHELRERANEIPQDKPVIIHCAGGYRSAAGRSIVAAKLADTKVFDLSEAIKEFDK